MQTSESKHGWVSELADGQLHGDALADALSRLSADEVAVRTWSAYHLVGDVLRTPDLAQGHDPAFLKRLRVRLQAERIEPPALANAPQVQSVAPARYASGAANGPVFTWPRLGAAMSVLMVAGAGWLWLNGRGQGEYAPALVQAPAPVLVGGSARPNGGEAVMLRDPRLDQLIQAHRQAAGGAALQVPAGFLRNATHEVQLVEAVSR